MKPNFQYILITGVLLILIASCSNNSTKIKRSMYYWKSYNWDLSKGELKHLKTLEIQKLYVKFFEVEADEIFGSIPTAKLSLHTWEKTDKFLLEEDSTLPASISHIEIIPTIFIRNEVFYNCSNSALDTLADNIIFLIDKYYKENIRSRQQSYIELQIDCDWTAKTKDSYFYLLKTLKKISNKTISCTLRLYPYKYPDLMGIPPVDKATLMCYNLINPLQNEHKNSIQINEELEKYLKNVAQYPRHLDIALPIFSWVQVYQNKRFTGLLNSGLIDLDEIATQIDPLWYEVNTDVEIGDLFLRVGDKIKLEEFTEKDTYDAIDLLKNYVKFDSTTTISLFHLDAENMKKYDDETYIHFFTYFNE